MIRLKNTSDLERPRRDPETGESKQGSVIDTYLTSNPLSRPGEWVEIPKDRTGRRTDSQWEKHLSQHKEEKSKGFHIVINPGETVELQNEEQAEYLYKTYGSMEGAPNEQRTHNWLIEVDGSGDELKGAQSLFAKYRENKKVY